MKCKCQETADNLKQMSRLTINFNLIYYILIMFLLIYITIYKTILLHLKCRHEDVCTTDQCHRQHRSVTLQLTYQTYAASNHSHPAFFCGRLAAQDFVMKCTEARAIRWPEVWKLYRSLTLLHFRTGGSE